MVLVSSQINTGHKVWDSFMSVKVFYSVIQGWQQHVSFFGKRCIHIFWSYSHIWTSK